MVERSSLRVCIDGVCIRKSVDAENADISRLPTVGMILQIIL